MKNKFLRFIERLPRVTGNVFIEDTLNLAD